MRAVIALASRARGSGRAAQGICPCSTDAAASKCPRNGAKWLARKRRPWHSNLSGMALACLASSGAAAQLWVNVVRKSMWVPVLWGCQTWRTSKCSWLTRGSTAGGRPSGPGGMLIAGFWYMFCSRMVWLMVGLLWIREHRSPCRQALRYRQGAPVVSHSDHRHRTERAARVKHGQRR